MYFIYKTIQKQIEKKKKPYEGKRRGVKETEQSFASKGEGHEGKYRVKKGREIKFILTHGFTPSVLYLIEYADANRTEHTELVTVYKYIERYIHVLRPFDRENIYLFADE